MTGFRTCVLQTLVSRSVPSVQSRYITFFALYLKPTYHNRARAYSLQCTREVHDIAKTCLIIKGTGKKLRGLEMLHCDTDAGDKDRLTSL